MRICKIICNFVAGFKNSINKQYFKHMIYSKEVQEMCVVAKGPKHGPAPIPEEGKWVKATEIKDISGMTHGIGHRLVFERFPPHPNTVIILPSVYSLRYSERSQGLRHCEHNRQGY